MLGVVFLSEIFTFMMSFTCSYIWWGRMNADIFEIGVVDAGIVSFLVGGILVVLINRQKMTESALKRSVEEKELLLREVYHRVKNNLNVVKSLLALQSRNITDSDAQRVFKTSQGRIKSITMLHDMLSRSAGPRDINFSKYLDSLSDMILENYSVSPGDVRLIKDLDVTCLDIDAAIPCGLIVHEIISNSLKHAFPEGRGEVYVGLKRQDNGFHELTIRDDGVGLPEEVDIHESESLGMQLIMGLTKQIGGTVEIKSGSGTSYSIQFRPETLTPEGTE